VVFLLILLRPIGNVFAEDILEKLREDSRFGVGIGVPYGFFGANIEASVLDYVSLSGGLGALHNEGCWVIGGRVYPFKRNVRFSPRLSAFYGTVAILKNEAGGTINYSTLLGWSFGVGFDWKFYGRNSVDFDVIYRVFSLPSGYSDANDESFLLGYGYHF